jgi:transposase
LSAAAAPGTEKVRGDWGSIAIDLTWQDDLPEHRRAGLREHAGRHHCRPVTEQEVERIREMVAAGATYLEIETETKRAQATIRRVCRRLGITPQPATMGSPKDGNREKADWRPKRNGRPIDPFSEAMAALGAKVVVVRPGTRR